MITLVGSLKGGSGKSTVSFNLAVWLAMADVEVQLFDLDPQGTLTDVVQVRTEDEHEPVLQVSPASDLESLSSDPAREVIIDVGTADMEAFLSAMLMADRIVIPVPPSQADIWSIQRFISIVEKQTNGKMPELLAFINRGDTHRAVRESDEAAAALVALPKVNFLKRRLAQRTVFRRSFSEGLATFELEPRGKGAKELTDLASSLYPHWIG